MTWIDADIQDGFLRRRGWRGRWLTIYHHRYSGEKEKTMRFHRHPWKWSISIVLRGYLADLVYGKGEHPLFREAGDIQLYRSDDMHRLESTGYNTHTLFIGICRQQKHGRNATVKYREGYGHYSEDSGEIQPPELSTATHGNMLL